MKQSCEDSKNEVKAYILTFSFTILSFTKFEQYS